LVMRASIVCSFGQTVGTSPGRAGHRPAHSIQIQAVCRFALALPSSPFVTTKLSGASSGSCVSIVSIIGGCDRDLPDRAPADEIGTTGVVADVHGPVAPEVVLTRRPWSLTLLTVF
jgi:hypothetical protein